MEWTLEDEKQAKKEYLSLIDTLRLEPEFELEWKGFWDDKMIESFTGKMTLIKGDKHKYMRHYIKNNKIFELIDDFDNHEDL